jgi:raffinose/stachyose/melibiose transport system substrate-binding protein
VGTDQSVPVTTYGYAIPSKADHVSAAKKFIAYTMGTKWLTQLSSDASILTPDPAVQVPAILQDLQKMLTDNPIYMNNDGIGADFPDLVKQFDTIDQGLITGKYSVAEYASKMKDAQTQYWKLNG